MKRKFTKRAGLYSLLFCGILFTSVNLTGCQEKELTKEEVTETSYYKGLKKKYDDLKKEKEDLEEQLKEATKADPDDKRAATYLKKLQKDSLIKLEVASASAPLENSFYSQEAILKSATKLIKKADLTFNYTPDTLKEEYKPKYIYTLYDEDNSVFEITVYEGNYIVFSDLPHKVYYCYNADLIGNAFVKSEKDCLEPPLLYKLANSPIVLIGEGETLHTTPVIQRFGQLFNQIEKEEMEENTQETEKKQATYTFYESGETIILTMYQTQISIVEEDGEEIWYRIDENNIEKIRRILD